MTLFIAVKKITEHVRLRIVVKHLLLPETIHTPFSFHGVYMFFRIFHEIPYESKIFDNWQLIYIHILFYFYYINGSTIFADFQTIVIAQNPLLHL